MLHTFSVNGSQLAASLKDATCYAGKDAYDPGTASIVMANAHKTNQLSVIACDGKGYYERRLTIEKAGRKSSRKFPQLCLSLQDASMLSKFISTRILGNVSLEIDDEVVNGKNSLKVILPNCGSTTVFSNADLTLPDYASIVERAEKARKVMPRLNDVYIPVHEMLRAGKVFPKSTSTAVRLYTTNIQSRGILALLEYLSPEDSIDIRVIFMLSEPLSEAA